MPSIKCTQVNTRTSRFGSEIPDATEKTVSSVHLAWLILGYSLPNTESPGTLSLSSNHQHIPCCGPRPGRSDWNKGQHAIIRSGYSDLLVSWSEGKEHPLLLVQITSSRKNSSLVLFAPEFGGPHIQNTQKQDGRGIP
jgi:hypothetical protein